MACHLQRFILRWVDPVQPLILAPASIEPFQLKFQKPFAFGGNFVTERVGYYLNLVSTSGLKAQGEAAPLSGVSQETLRKTEHDLKEALTSLNNLQLVPEKKSLIEQLRHNETLRELCSSSRFAIESAIFILAAKANGQSLAGFLGTDLADVSSAGLLQGTYDQVMMDAKLMVDHGVDIFKIKVGDRNIPLDVKKVNEIRTLIGEDGLIRLDGNRVWSLKEASLFMELVGHKQIEYFEEPLSDISQLNEFYNRTHIPVALDETLLTSRCGATAPGRCSPTLAQHEAVQAYILKPMILGGIIPTLDWIEEARSTGRKAVISSSFESSVGLKVLANLSLLTGQVAGLGTSRWLSGENIVNEQGIILKELLT
ncbi:MAG: o-succinylbenzoate synthase [Candidatus Omnitrophica bacterium]|nr:o-succinylbenzoate synthase [Candidatus Omnitrophota bacterium]